MRYLKEAGVDSLSFQQTFDTPEGEKLLSLFTKETYVQAMLAFPRNLFKDVKFSKSLLIVQKRGKGAKQVSQVLLGDIPEFKNRKIQKIHSNIRKMGTRNVIINLIRPT